MGFLDFLSRKPKYAESVILIDIGTNNVAGACVQYDLGQLPTFLYTNTVPIEMHEGELRESAMLRSLRVLGEKLVREGAPVLARATGSGTATTILVSIDAPWQETTVHTEQFEEAEPFVFTQSLVDKRLDESHRESTEKVLVDESIVGTILNGYETSNPNGKRTQHASVIILTSHIARSVASHIVSTLERLYHTKNVLPIAGSSLRYQAMREVFPHEHDAIILDATNPELPSISLVRRNLIVSLIQATESSTADNWADAITEELTELAKQNPLPRTIFLLAREPEIDSLRQLLDTVDFGFLWLSDNPPKIISVLPTHISASVRNATDAPIDTVLLLMAIFFDHAKKRGEGH